MMLFTPSETGLPLVGRFWCISKDGDPHGLDIYKRHYSRYTYADGRQPKLFVGPGEKMILVRPAGNGLFVWRKFKDDSGQTGVNCAVFRNESPQLSSVLINNAVEIARLRWPTDRFYTYVNPTKIRSSNPGCCFLKAGWTRCGTTKGGLLILELSCS